MKFYKVATSSAKQLPRQHRIALASTSLLVAFALLWQPGKHTTPTFPSTQRVEIQLAHDDIEILSENNSEPLGAVIDQADPEFLAPKDELEQKLDEVTDVAHSHTVTSGDTLGSIFSQYALPISDMYRLIDANKTIQNLHVGQSIEWSLNKEGKVKELSIQRNKKTTDTFVLGPKGYTYKAVEKTGVIQSVFLTGRVSGSFYNSAQAAGLSPSQIQTVVKALQWKFDFGRVARKGDRFAVSVDREFIDGKSVGRGDVKALFYLSGNREVFIMRHSDGQFYDVNGQSLNRALRRYPTAKRYRISSSFNPNRKHPVTGRISPHNGTDFAVPIGTPILSAGDGVVVKSRYHRLAGNYIVVKHGRDYMTRYLHLSKRLVKVGDRIKMGERIALSGNTGRSTGPHLHFELIKNNRPVNAMKVPLPQAAPIAGKARSVFKKEASEEKQRLLNVMPG